MEKKNSAHQLVIESLTEALLQLMEQKKLSEITISQLCEKAGVSRISFYRNFDYISDILSEYLKSRLKEWWTEFDGAVDLNNTPEDFWKLFFQNLKKDERIIKLIYKSKESMIIKNLIFSACGPANAKTEEEAYARAMLAGTIFGYTDEWIRRGMKEVPEHLSLRSIASILQSSLN